MKRRTTVGADSWFFEEADAAPNEAAWEVRAAAGGGIVVKAWNDDRSVHDKLILRRVGTVIQTVLPPAVDLNLLPELKPIASIINARRRLTESGYQEDLPPVLIHTKTAKAIWPVFGLPAAAPASGCCSALGVLLVWAPALDEFVFPPPSPAE